MTQDNSQKRAITIKGRSGARADSEQMFDAVLFVTFSCPCRKAKDRSRLIGGCQALALRQDYAADAPGHL